jgi:hypothetical protein
LQATRTSANNAASADVLVAPDLMLVEVASAVARLVRALVPHSAGSPGVEVDTEVHRAPYAWLSVPLDSVANDER